MRHLLTLIFLFTLQMSYAQLQFMNTFDGGGREEYTDITSMGGGNFLCVGFSDQTGNGGRDGIVSKVDALGRLVWTKSYGGNGDDEIRSVLRTPDNHYLLAFTTASFSSSNDVMVIKINENGDVIWSKQFGSSADENAYEMINTSDGNHAITFRSVGYGFGSNERCLLKFDSNGNFIWCKAYGTNGSEWGGSITELPDGSIIQVGSVGLTNVDAWIFKTDQFGNMVWSLTYDMGTSENFSGVFVQNDTLYVGGKTNVQGGGGTDAVFASFTSAGVFVEGFTYGGAQDDNGGIEFQFDDNNFLVAASTLSFGPNPGEYDALVLKVDKSGNELWSRGYGANGKDGYGGILEMPDGGLMIAGDRDSTNTWAQANPSILRTDNQGVIGCKDYSVPTLTTMPLTVPTGGSYGSYMSESVTMNDAGMIAQDANIFGHHEHCLTNNCGTPATNPSSVSLCNGDSVFLQNAWQTTAGVYADTALTVGGCDSIVSTTVTMNGTNPTITLISSTPPTCNGGNDGTISFSISGGTTPYTAIEWEDINADTIVAYSDITMIGDANAAGPYKILVEDATGCIATATHGLVDPALISVDAGADRNVCVGDSTILGGSPTASNAVSYVWTYSGSMNQITLSNPTVTPTTDVTYNVQVLDNNGCTNSDQVVLTMVEAMNIASTSQTNESCFGICDATATVTPGQSPSTWYYFHMYDTFGDGWNGGSVDFSNDGVNINFTFTGGGSAVDSVELVDGVPLSISWNSGSFDMEVSWYLINSLGDTLHNQQPTPAAGQLWTGTSETPVQTPVYTWSSGGTTSTISAQCAGVVTVTTTLPNGCAATETYTITSPPEITINYSITNGCTPSVDVTPGSTGYTYQWSTGATTEDVSGLSNGPLSVSVSDIASCVELVTMTISATPAYQTTVTNIICEGDSLQVGMDYHATAGQFPDSHLTTMGCDSIIIYEITLADTTLPSSVLSGQVTLNTVGLGLGDVYLYQIDTTNMSDFTGYDQQALTGDGSFEFTSVPEGNYLVRGIADPLNFPLTIPTYSIDSWLWQQGVIYSVSSGCRDTVTNADVHIYEMSPTVGSGSVTGNLSYNGGKQAGDPVPGIDIFIEQIPGGIVGHDTTDNDGNFDFQNVADGHYRIHAEVIGYDMDTLHQLTVTTNNQAFDVDVCMDSTAHTIDLCGLTGISSELPAMFDIYPNPATDFVYFSGIAPGTEVMLSTVTGKVVLEAKLGNSGRLDVSQLSTGLYLFAIKTDTYLERGSLLIK